MSTVREQLDRLAAIKERMRTNLVAQGVTVPAETMLDAMAEQVLSVAGEDGVSCTHSWNGTTLNVTSASGTTSADLRGPQGIQGIQGERGETGATGPAGSDASVTQSSIKTALGYVPASDYSIDLYNGTGGNPKPVRFASFSYGACDSNNGISALIRMVSGHGNGVSYVFLQDAIINVAYNGTVTVDNFKYYGAETATYDGAVRQYGDIFWLVDETNKIVDFYCLMGQYSRVNMTPWKRLTYSSKGSVTQYTSCTVYSSGNKNWANNNSFAVKANIPTVPTNVSAFTNDAGYATKTEVAAKAPAYTYGTADLEAGSSALETGKLYFVYE